MSVPPMSRPPLGWHGKFKVAFRGIYFGIAGQASFVVHFTVMALVIVLAIFLKLDWISWSILLLCMGLVMTAELLNSAVETLFRGLPPDIQARSWKALDIAAGAVLFASMIASIVGCIVLVPAVLRYFG
ncbi:MAG TPA: diacylglycerol kinase [Gemmatales bacterium]|nr:diacylglycerol kinase [Gemmatales bacterium]